jgi:hypothetical protein
MLRGVDRSKGTLADQAEDSVMADELTEEAIQLGRLRKSVGLSWGRFR